MIRLLQLLCHRGTPAPVGATAGAFVDSGVGNNHVGHRIGPQILKGTESLTRNKQALPPFIRAERKFREELQAYLSKGETGLWLVYSPDGCVDSSHEVGTLLQKYGDKLGGEYFLGCVQRDPPAAEITPNWFVRRIWDPSRQPSENSRRGPG